MANHYEEQKQSELIVEPTLLSLDEFMEHTINKANDESEV